MTEATRRLAVGNPFSRGSRSRRRGLVAGVAVVVAALGLASCQPNPTLNVVALPSGSGKSFLASVNDAGMAVGTSNLGDSTQVAFLVDTSTGAVTDISKIPVSPDYPSGGTMTQAMYVSARGMIVGSDSAGNVVLHDLSTGSWAAPGCTAPGDGTGASLYDDHGDVVCGGKLYDVATHSDVAVAEPSGCQGRVADVNNVDLVVGYCDAGTEPMFVTDLSTGTTTGFGSAQGISDPYHEIGFIGTLSNNGMLSVQNTSNDQQSYLFNVSGATPVIVPIGGSSLIDGVIWGVGDNGLVGMAVSDGGHSDGVGYDTVNGAVRGISSPQGITPSVFFGVNSHGVVVGEGESGTNGVPIYGQSNVVAAGS